MTTTYRNAPLSLRNKESTVNLGFREKNPRFEMYFRTITNESDNDKHRVIFRLTSEMLLFIVNGLVSMTKNDKDTKIEFSLFYPKYDDNNKKMDGVKDEYKIITSKTDGVYELTFAVGDIKESYKLEFDNEWFDVIRDDKSFIHHPKVNAEYVIAFCKEVESLVLNNLNEITRSSEYTKDESK